ncbi:MAG: cytochrome c biogenesis protein CcsA, partial [Verrucomicrobiota bacterium]|nr:cytochrome c biogenesis protein CcsA [Verrucomicrobiota bacterium]
MKSNFPLISVIIVLTVLFSSFLKNDSSEYDFKMFSSLPIMDEGRVQPIDSFSRNLLTMVSGKPTITNSDDEKIHANEWLLDLITGKPQSFDTPFIRITNKDLLASLKLEPRKGSYRYSYNEIVPEIPTLEKVVRIAQMKDERDRDLYDRESIKLASKLTILQRTLISFEDPRLLPPDQLFPTVQGYMKLEEKSIPLVIPPKKDEQWRPMMSSLVAAHPVMQEVAKENDLKVSPYALRWGSMLISYASDDTKVFNDSLTGYLLSLEKNSSDQLKNIKIETLFNQLNVFVKAAWLYLIVFLTSCVGWILRKEKLIRFSASLMTITAIPHTLALITRSFLSGYPPVTNLYSSAIFIGWGAVLMGILMEYGFKKKGQGFGSIVGGIVGSISLLIAYFLAGDGDTLHQLQAVLDTRFWLATHVITITLGYMATFIAGALGIFYILSGVFSKRMNEQATIDVDRFIYGVTCFALLLSFVGTVLGGLWADDSWGRFWGWDPKENGALLIVTWGAIMLHARWGKIIKIRGFAVMA